MTKQEATALVAVLAASFPRQPVEPPTLEAYAVGVGDLDVGLATTAGGRFSMRAGSSRRSPRSARPTASC